MPGPEFLEGDRLSLHLVEPEDHEFIYRNWMGLRRQPDVMVQPWSEEQVTEWVSADDSNHFIACQDGDSVGHAVLLDIDWENRRGELGYLIIAEEQGKGYATEAADLCLTHAFDELGLHKVWAKVQGDHDASKRVLEKLGFKEEGVMRDRYYAYGDYVDNYRYGLLKSEP